MSTLTVSGSVKENRLRSTAITSSLNVERFIAAALVIALICGQRFALSFSGGEIPLVIPVFYSAIIFWLLRQNMILSTGRFILLIASFSVAIFAEIIRQNTNDSSILSMIFWIVTYSPLILLNRNALIINWIRETFQKTMTLISVIALFQFLLQFAGISLIDIFRTHIPSNFLVDGYNYVIPIKNLPGIFRANGIFFLEPAVLSRWLAWAILIETYHRINLKRIYLFVPAMLLTFSGTGVLALAAGLIIQASQLKRMKQLLLGLVLIVVVSIPFFISNYGKYWLARFTEFERTGSSADVRFIAPYEGTYQYLVDASSEQMLLGKGPGSVDTTFVGIYVHRNIHPILFLKLFYEYGAIVGFLFSAFLLLCFFGNRVSPPIAVSLFIGICFLSTGLLQPQSVFLAYLLVMMVPRGKDNISRSAYALSAA